MDTHRDVVRAGYEKAVMQYGDFDVPFEEYEQRVMEVVRRRAGQLSESSGSDLVRDVLERTHLQDLYLAQAMALGREPAWSRFLERFGAFLLASTQELTNDRERASEAVGNILGDLFFTDRSHGSSRLGGYSGVSTLQRWLWSVLQSRIIDSVRKTRWETPADDASKLLEQKQTTRGATASGTPEETVLQTEHERLLGTVLPAAFGTLEPRDRLLMLLHYVDGVPQKEIARLYLVDASRVSRWLDRACRCVRRVTCELLVHDHGLEPPDASEMASRVLGCDWGTRLRDWLKGAPES